MEQITIAAAGDVSTGFETPASGFTHVINPLRQADIRFAQVERIYSERGDYQEQSIAEHSRQHPSFAADFKTVPFDVLSVASNHTGDWGPVGIADTMETFRNLGIATIGAGLNISAARKPVVLDRKGLRIAFLGYVSTTLPQYWATETRAGSVPMRAHTYYEPYEFQPGAPARVVTVPHEADLDQLVRDVKNAKDIADHVIVSLHWGTHYVPKPSDYQPIVAHAAIDAGATAILGHHAHQPQGIEIYKGAVIFYSIGNFCFWQNSHRKSGRAMAAPGAEHALQDIYSLEPDPGITFHFRRHFNEGGIAFIDLDKNAISRVSYLPTLMNDAGQPEPVPPRNSQFAKSLEYLNWAGKFIPGGITDIKVIGDRYEIFTR